MKLIAQLTHLPLGILVSVASWAADTKCINIYYDQVPNSKPVYIESRLDAINLQNLLGHFPQYQQYVSPIHLYKKNEINRCQATFYVGSYYSADKFIPKSFYEDFAATDKSVVWMNYNVWGLGDDNLEKLWNVTFDKSYDIDERSFDANKLPGYYKFFTYKGETFEKFGTYDKDHKQFLAASEIIGLQPIDEQTNQYVVSWAIHSVNKSKLPYILHHKNWWYVADIPFGYITESDRYQIFADILFDVLNEQPEDNGKHYALVRVEDVSAATNLSFIKTLANMFARLKTPYAISLIPIYSDPLRVYNQGHYVAMNRRPWFIDALKYSVSRGANILMHGVTHQFGSIKNPYSGVTAEDYEFWDKVNNGPIPGDSVNFILPRLEKGAALIQDAGLTISAWLTPHYEASALDIALFGDLFVWSVGRGSYWVSKICHLNPLPIDLTLDQGKINAATNNQRRQALGSFKITTDNSDYINAAHFPYVIYGDYYNVRLIPENLNYVALFAEKEKSLYTIDTILQNAKRNKVLRDAWASFYIHPILLWPKEKGGLGNSEGDTSEIERLIKGIQDLGYEFVDLKDWQASHFKPKRPEPIELEPILGQCD